MLWLVVLPVVHAACAVQPRMAATVCGHETADPDDSHDEAASAHTMHHDASSHETRHEGMHHEASESVPGDTSEPNLSCCLFESPVFDRPATPVTFAHEETGVVPAVTTARAPESVVRPTTVRYPSSGIGPPSLPPLSPAHLSVFLI